MHNYTEQLDKLASQGATFDSSYDEVTSAPYAQPVYLEIFDSQRINLNHLY